MLRVNQLVDVLKMETALAEPVDTWEEQEWRKLEEAYVNTINELKRRLYHAEIALEVHQRFRPKQSSTPEGEK